MGEERKRQRKRKKSISPLPFVIAGLALVVLITASVVVDQKHVKQQLAEKGETQTTEESTTKDPAKDTESTTKETATKPAETTTQPESTTAPQDTTAPVISGTKDLTVTEGDTVSYKSGVTVTDDTDPDPQLSIDNSAVKLDTPGTYDVIYTAKDAAGNVSTVTITVTVKEKVVTDETTKKLYEKADAVLADILKDDMDEVHKCYAIWHWVRTHVPWYGGNVDHDPVDQALKGLAGNAGDCYTDTVTYQVLLERAGFECIFMQRSPGIGYHYWLMVKIEGNWYHSDPAPIYKNQFVCFLGTDAQLKWFTDEMRPNYYTHDTEGIPTTPDTPRATVTYKDGTYTLNED
ncbi:MAG: transglutaminase domain-containing protein [Lachnospiraceae bacterium]|nr:transglutaminase domain-containing protein [Lachnospiraceae bacterium]